MACLVHCHVPCHVGVDVGTAVTGEADCLVLVTWWFVLEAVPDALSDWVVSCLYGCLG